VITGGHLEEAARHPEAGVAEAVRLLGGMDLAESGEGGHVSLQGVVVPAGVDEMVALDAAGVGDEVLEGDLDRGAGVGHRELLELRAHRFVERHEPGRLRLQQQRRGVQLAERSELEERVGRDLDAGGRVRHPPRGDRRLVARQHPAHGPRDAVTGPQLG
jgi:hypothetical protein